MMGLSGEAAFVEWLLLHEKIGKCVTMEMFRTQAKRIAGELGMPGFVAGESWEAGFWARHERLTVRTAEATATSGYMAVNRLGREMYFKTIHPLFGLPYA